MSMSEVAEVVATAYGVYVCECGYVTYDAPDGTCENCGKAVVIVDERKDNHENREQAGKNHGD